MQAFGIVMAIFLVLVLTPSIKALVRKAKASKTTTSV